jgi:UDP-N-acetylglucosamine 2-epimerase (non-hydrolysing)
VKDRKKILCVVGTRPEAIKMAPVIAELTRHRRRVRTIVCVTAQHRQMLDQVLALFGIRPDFDLNLMEPDQALAPLTARLLSRLDEVVGATAPDWIVAQGDTTTVLAAAMIAFYRHIPFAHVEAGLRTGDLEAPFPEEANRRFADLIASALFAPTQKSRQILLREGVPTRSVFVTGNTIVDAVQDIAKRRGRWKKPPLASLPRAKAFVLVTVHRRESFGRPLRDVCLAIRDLARRFGPTGVHFVLPVHPNPKVSSTVWEVLGKLPHVTLTEPLDYVSLVQVMKRSVLILTDSGGIQEEAPSLRVPVLVMREKTERPEGLRAGVALLVGTRRARIVKTASRLLANDSERARMARRRNPYGDGRAAARIAAVLLRRGNR